MIWVHHLLLWLWCLLILLNLFEFSFILVFLALLILLLRIFRRTSLVHLIPTAAFSIAVVGVTTALDGRWLDSSSIGCTRDSSGLLNLYGRWWSWWWRCLMLMHYGDVALLLEPLPEFKLLLEHLQLRIQRRMRNKRGRLGRGGWKLVRWHNIWRLLMATKMMIRNNLFLPLIEQLIMQLLKLTLLLTNVHFMLFLLFGKMVLKYEEITSVVICKFSDFLIFKMCLKNDFLVVENK